MENYSHSNKSFTIIKNPWLDDFNKLLKNAEKEILLASPYIKLDIARLITTNVKTSVKTRYLNSFKLTNYYQGSSDLEALKLFLDKGVSVKSHHQLHAKVFIFDSIRAVVTSSNLTYGGLENNYEYGLLVDDESLVKAIRQDYLALYSNKEAANDITYEIIQTAQNIIEAVPKEKKPKGLFLREKGLFKKIDNDELVAEKFSGGIEAIASNLKGWSRDLFLLLDEISEDVFDLERVYKFENTLKGLHPRNENIQPKIRQQLQYLRNHGLLEFLGHGRYKKLWANQN